MSASDVAIIQPAELSARLDEPDLLLVQVTSGEVFAQAHIAGAVLVEPAQLVGGVAPATGRLPDLARLEDLFVRIGYRPGQQIVVYDDEGGGWAGRMAWTLDVIGERSWAYLDGGLHHWVAAGLPLAQGGFVPAAAPLGEPLVIDTTPIAEIDDVLQAIDDPAQTIWDVRSAEEYRGERSAAARAGHIPGAVNLDWLLLKDPHNAQRLTLTTPDALAAAGVPVNGPLITHCQTHHRSGLSYMLGRLLGLDIRAYHGSWSEWGNRYDTPVETPVAS